MAVINIQHIAQRAGFLGGKPYIVDTRMSIQQVAVLHTRHNWSVEQIAEQHDLTPAQIHAALSYYYDHKHEIDATIATDDALARQVGIPISELRTRPKD